MNFLDLLYKKKEKIPFDFLIDEIDVDSSFFIIFWKFFSYKTELSDQVKVSMEKLTQSKILLWFTYCVSKLQTYDWNTPHKDKNLFILESLTLIKKSYDYISKFFFYALPDTQSCKNSAAKVFFLQLFKGFQSSKSCLIRFGIRFPGVCFEKFINFDLFSQIYIKIKELDYLLKN